MKKHLIRLLSLGAVSSFCLFLASIQPATEELIEEQPKPQQIPINQPRAILTRSKINTYDDNTEKQH
jgi:hypothetical protein